jgi:hypothetical protein
MANLDSLINGYSSKLRNAKTLDEVKTFVERDLYKKFGVSRRVEKTAYEIADIVAEKLKIKND